MSAPVGMDAWSEVGAELDYGFVSPEALRVETLHVGAEREPVLVIDEVMERPAPLVTFAARQAKFAPLREAGNFYPGVRAPAPRDYVQGLYATIRPILARTFGRDPASPARISCALSLVTLPPEALNLAQRLPHIDTTDGGQIAVLHYLCDASHGGTAFYRHRATGFETVDEARAEQYLVSLRAELERDGAPGPAYVSGATALHDQIGRVEARFNRVVIYRSRLLHSGVILRADALSDDPRTGRLTANTFVNFE